MFALLSLLLAPALAAPPSLSCTPLEVAVRAEEKNVADARPKGFAWEGVNTVSVLEDGRIIVARHAALEKLSRRDLKKQHQNGADRVTELYVLTAEGEVQSRVTIPRGTLLETVALPGGGVAIARTEGTLTLIDYIDEDGTYVGSVRMPEDPQADSLWRKHNPIQASGPNRITAAGPDRVVTWHAGTAIAFDLANLARSTGESLYPLGIFTLRGRRDRASELLLVDRNRAVTWLDPELNVLRTRPCDGCRVVGHDKPVDLDKAEGSWLPAVRLRGAAMAEAMEGGIEVRFIGLSAKEKEGDPIQVPVDGEGRFSWRLREGPWGTTLVTVSQDGQHVVRAVQPGHAEPVWTWTAPEGWARSDEELVADALGPYVRIRVVEGHGLEETTREALLVDPRDGRASTPVKPTSLSEPLREALSSPWVNRHFAGDVLLRDVNDPILTRMEQGDGVAQVERCRVRLSP